MGRVLTETELGTLLAGFTESAFRFEIRERYNSTVGKEPFRKFLAGEADDYAWHRPWLERIKRDLANGKTWQRVRIVSVPLSNYTRYGIQVARTGIEVGEDIRYLRRDVAEQLGLAPLDAWLLDSRTLVHLHFNDEDDSFAGAELISDSDVLARHLQWRELGLLHAQTCEEFVASLR